MVQPHSRIEAAICATCASEWVRALRALGISAASGRRSTWSAGQSISGFAKVAGSITTPGGQFAKSAAKARQRVPRPGAKRFEGPPLRKAGATFGVVVEPVPLAAHNRGTGEGIGER